MDRGAALTEIAAREGMLRAHGVAAAYLFGSTARDEAHVGSDLDLFIDVMPGHRFSLIDLCAVQNLLERELAVEVDVVTRNGLLRDLRPQIESEAVRVF